MHKEMPVSTYEEDGLTYAERQRRHENSPEGRDEMLIFGDVRTPPTEMEALLEDMLVRSLRRIPLLEPLEREANSIYPHLWDLMRLKPAQRRRAVRKPPFRNLSLANLFLDESSKAIPKRPQSALEFAEAAEWIAGLPWPEEEQSRAASIRARAWIAQGDSLREARDWAGAELRFGAAFSILQKIPAGLFTDHTDFCRELSQLREDQGRLYEAAVLYLKAMQLHRKHFRAEKLPEDGLVHLAFLSLKQNDLSRAMRLFTSLCEGGPSEHPSDEVGVDLGRAICLAALGLAEPARELLGQSLPKRRHIYERDTRLPYEWLECRISVHLGDLDRASLPRLEAVRRWLIQRDGLAPIALCSIDLALAYAKQGKAARRFPALLEDLAEHRDAQSWAHGALTWFRDALDQCEDPAMAARRAAELVHRREIPASIANRTRPSMSSWHLAGL
jgi:tetratricopeptide (TPR) repeat protein